MDEVLHPIEILLRTRFAHHYAKRTGVEGSFARGEGLTQPGSPQAMRVEEHALSDLDRSKEAFVTRYRQEIKVGGRYAADAYARMPIWVAVEAFSFGSLSRLIEASGQSGVLADVAGSLQVSPKTLPSQVRSFVYLRNRVAHCAKLWNHSVLDVPGLLPNITRQAKRHHRQFHDHSVYKILVALDDIATKNDIADTWLTRHVDPLLEGNPLLDKGITTPARYGQMPPDLLV
nr:MULTISPECIES: Abi family protein [unclassified Actinomyces]